VRRFPSLGTAWDLVNQEGGRGPLDEKTQRLLKLAIGIGALREGAVHSGVRKARDAGANLAEMEQVVALAASTIGFPASVAVWSWVRGEAGGSGPARGPRGRERGGRPSTPLLPPLGDRDERRQPLLRSHPPRPGGLHPHPAARPRRGCPLPRHGRPLRHSSLRAGGGEGS